MSRLYLITGFLGAGKTTLLKQLVRCFPGERLALIVNEFGKEGVDGALLADLGATLSEIDDGSIFCACRAEQFKNALLGVLDQRPDVVLVEASGLSDPTDVGRLMSGEPFCATQYAGAICLVDGARFHKVYETARVCKKQLAVADAVIINKLDLATPEQLAYIRREANALRPGIPVFETTFGALDPAWLSQIKPPEGAGGAPVFRDKDITLQKLTLVIDPACKRFTLEHLIGLFAEDTYRVKGFAALEEGTFQVDCVGPIVRIDPWTGEPVHPNRLTVLFGNGLPARKSIQNALGRYPGAAELDLRR